VAGLFIERATLMCWGVAVWDAMILNSAIETGSPAVRSEDLNDGQTV